MPWFLFYLWFAVQPGKAVYVPPPTYVAPGIISPCPPVYVPGSKGLTTILACR